MKPAFFGFSGFSLSSKERSFFNAAAPAGYILFARNISSREQVKALCADLKALSGNTRLPILIDQEGGRVARLRPPLSPEFPPAAIFGALYAQNSVAGIKAARLNAEAIAVDLYDLGITVNCLPLLDVPVPGAHDIIGDRAYGHDAATVTALGQATLNGLQAGGIVGVIKHLPGHGRAGADSHLELPVVHASLAELEQDIAPFRALAGAPMAMTAHVVYSAWHTNVCATHSSYVIKEVIRQQIGFDGLLMSDDLGMKALGGDFGTRANTAINAGCDIALHCSGDMAEMEAVAEALGEITSQTFTRLTQAMTWAERPSLATLMSERDALLATL